MINTLVTLCSGQVVVFWYYLKMWNESQNATEQAGAYQGIDAWDDQRILAALVEGQERAIAAVKAVTPAIARAAAVLAERIGNGGTLYYAGAGTSIRIGVQDGSELPATFGMPEKQIAYLIAGGPAAMFDTLADAEDDAANGARQAEACCPADALIAVAASGSTPFTVAAAETARARGCFVIAVVNNSGSRLGRVADAEIVLDSGPEVIAGSTRMGAGTAQKAALNFLSTLAHVKLGAVHDGLMVGVQVGNAKIRRRALAMVSRISGASEQDAETALATSGDAVKPAVLICAGAKTLDAAQRLLTEAQGNLRLALARLSAS